MTSARAAADSLADLRNARRHAVICILGASLGFSVAAALVKAVAPTIPTFEIVLFRSLVALLAMLPLLRRHGRLSALRTRRPLGHLVRTGCGFLGMVCAFHG